MKTLIITMCILAGLWNKSNIAYAGELTRFKQSLSVAADTQEALHEQKQAEVKLRILLVHRDYLVKARKEIGALADAYDVKAEELREGLSDSQGELAREAIASRKAADEALKNRSADLADKLTKAEENEEKTRVFSRFYKNVRAEVKVQEKFYVKVEKDLDEDLEDIEAAIKKASKKVVSRRKLATK
jgi:hypothetical protein